MIALSIILMPIKGPVLASSIFRYPARKASRAHDAEAMCRYRLRE
jgi:hypothetical protein